MISLVISLFVLFSAPPQRITTSEENDGLLESWDLANNNAHFTVAHDGSGTYRTIKEAVDALSSMGHNRPGRAIIYVKAGVYNEKVEIGNKLHNVMFVGDGIDKTIVTGNRNVPHGYTTLNSATFGNSFPPIINFSINH